jgi:hypothetical protein
VPPFLDGDSTIFGDHGGEEQQITQVE